MKKLIALLLALVMVFGIVACGAKDDAPAADAPAADAPAADAPAEDADPNTYDPAKYDGLLAWYYPFPHPFGEACKAGIDAYCEDTGIDVNVVVGPEFTMVSELESIEAMYAQGYRYFSVFPCDAAATDGMYEELTAKGCTFNNFGTSTTEETVAQHVVSTNLYNSAYEAMEFLGEKLGNKGGIMICSEIISDAGSQERLAAINDYIAEHPDMSIVAEAYDYLTITEATTKINDTLMAHGDEVDAIINLGFTCTQAMVSVLTDYYDRGGEKIYCVGVDTDDLIFQGIRDGLIDATIAQNSFGIGYISGEVLRLQAEGYQAKEGCYQIDSGVTLVRADNIDTYEEDLEAVTQEIMSTLTTVYMEKP